MVGVFNLFIATKGFIVQGVISVTETKSICNFVLPSPVSFFCSHIIEVPWSEDLLTVVHSLLERQVPAHI